MAIAFVQSVSFTVNGAGSGSVIVPSVAAGNFLALLVSAFAAAPVDNTPTDDKSNTWNKTTLAGANGNSNSYLNYAMNVAAGTTTVTDDHSAGNYWSEGSCSEWSGIATASALDQQAGDNTQSDSTPTVGPTGTTTQADELVLAVTALAGVGANIGIDLPSGYTNLYIVQSANDTIAHSSDYKIVSATGTQSADWGTLTTSPSQSSKIATFKAAGGGGGGTVIPVFMAQYRQRVA